MTKEEPSTSFDMALTEQEKIAKSVEYEILKIESLRSLIFAIVIGLLAITFLIATYIITDIKYGDKLPLFRLIIESLLIGFSGFELLMWYFINQCLDKEKSVPVSLRYLVAFVEISLPTLLIFISSHVVSIHALYLPPVFL
jgi:pilus assembly protein TadC